MQDVMSGLDWADVVHRVFFLQCWKHSYKGNSEIETEQN